MSRYNEKIEKVLGLLVAVLLIVTASCGEARAERVIFADEASQKAFADVYAVDNESFKRDIVHVKDEAKASFLKEYMALMNYTAANSKANYDAYIAASDKAFDDAEKSRYAENLTCQLHIHKCMVYMYSGSMVSGGIQFWKSYRAFKTAETKYPGYEGQMSFRGIYNVLFSQIPEKWKTLKGLLGLPDGNLTLGFRQIEQYRQSVLGLEGVSDEALVFSFANMFFSHDQDLTAELVKVIKGNQTAVVRYAYILSCGQRQMGTEAERVLDETEEVTMDRFPLLYHQRAKYALRRLDTEATLKWSHRFLGAYAGVSNKNNAYLQMGYAYLLSGDRLKAKEMADKCIAIKSDFDIDKRSHDEAARLMACDVRMLRARLQFEYGDFEKSLETLHSFEPRAGDELEHIFRLARGEEKIGEEQKALTDYDRVIALSENSTRYFGPYSCIYAADISLKRGDKKRAQMYVEVAKRLNNGEYKKELDQRIELTERVIKGKK
ncbi:MAG: hypothetical protein II951_04620 [Bacteroidales bacterium]|nr:hypothetical protein [Bacteroidales bacterium]